MKWDVLKQDGDVPLPRSSHTINAVGGKAYLLGGEHEPRTPIDSRVHEYDLKEGRWTELTCSGNAPSPRVAHTAAAVGGNLYIFGGRSGIEMGEGSTNDLHMLDLSSRTWTEVAVKGTPPDPRSFHAMVAVRNKLYVFGGCGQAGRLADLHSFECESQTWEQLPSSDAVKGRGGAGLVAEPSGDALYVIGGFAGHELDDVHRFDLATCTWDCPQCCTGAAKERWSQLPARSVFGIAPHMCSACAHGGHLVLFGGEVDPSDKGHAGAGQFSNESYCFDISKEEVQGGWHRLEVDQNSELPTPRGWFAACATAHGLLVHGGNSPSNERLDDMYMLDLHAQ